MICQECCELVTEYLEGALSADHASRFEAHLSDCAGCVAYVEQVRVTVRSVGVLPAEPADPDVRERLLAAFRELRG